MREEIRWSLAKSMLMSLIDCHDLIDDSTTGVSMVQTQQPVVISEVGGEPDPDVTIVLRPITGIGYPRAKDVSCVIEVAGTTSISDNSR
jgi:hypothetical protein